MILLLQRCGVKGSGCSALIAVLGSSKLIRFFSCDLRNIFPISVATNLPSQTFVDQREFCAQGRIDEAVCCPFSLCLLGHCFSEQQGSLCPKAVPGVWV